MSRQALLPHGRLHRRVDMRACHIQALSGPCCAPSLWRRSSMLDRHPVSCFRWRYTVLAHQRKWGAASLALKQCRTDVAASPASAALKQQSGGKGPKTAASAAASADAVAGRGSDAEAPGTPPPAGPALKHKKRPQGAAAAVPEGPEAAKGSRKGKAAAAEQLASAAAKDAKALAATDGFEVSSDWCVLLCLNASPDPSTRWVRSLCPAPA